MNADRKSDKAPNVLIRSAELAVPQYYAVAFGDELNADEKDFQDEHR